MESTDGRQPQQSVAVRLALGETQLVAETKQFLLENGIQLDAFQDVIVYFFLSVIFLRYFPRRNCSIGTEAALQNRNFGEKFGRAV